MTVENLECAVPLNTRLRMFVHVFIGIPVRYGDMCAAYTTMYMYMCMYIVNVHLHVHALPEATQV